MTFPPRLLLETDQKRCFDEAGREIPCPGSGQDAELRSPSGLAGKRFDASGETVRDRLTGLTWCRNANPAEFPLDRQAAGDFIAQMNAERAFGIGAWRLPARRELFTLISHEAVGPALPHGHPFENVFSGYCWTRTPCSRLPDQAWSIHLGGGRIQPGMTHRAYIVWPLLSPESETGVGGIARGWQTQGGAAVDRRTGLMWSLPPGGLASRPIAWERAIDAVRAMNRMAAGGFSDWRLPNIRELENLVDTGVHSPALSHGHPFGDVAEGCWSSTTSLYEPRYAWVLYTRDGAVGVGFKARADFRFWAVRRTV